MSLAVLNQMLLERYPQTSSVWKYFLVGLQTLALTEKGKIYDLHLCHKRENYKHHSSCFQNTSIALYNLRC